MSGLEEPATGVFMSSAPEVTVVVEVAGGNPEESVTGAAEAKLGAVASLMP